VDKRIGKGNQKPSSTLAGKDPRHTITVGRIELGNGYFALLDRNVENPQALIEELRGLLQESKAKSKKVKSNDAS
jgi:hypothetical protein